jgi:hypothetical protein
MNFTDSRLRHDEKQESPNSDIEEGIIIELSF